MFFLRAVFMLKEKMKKIFLMEIKKMENVIQA